MFMGNMFNALLVFQAERPVFLREQSNKMYSVGPYYLAKTLADTPVILLTPMINILIIYWSMDLARTTEQFFLSYLAQFLIAFTAASIGYFLSSLFEDELTAAGLAPVAIMPMMLFGGLLTNNPGLPGWLTWIQYISPIKYGSEAMLQVEFKYDKHGLKEGLNKQLGFHLSLL